MSFCKRSLAVAAVAALMMPSFALAQVSEADQEACTPDVFRLCQDQIPDEGRIVACLQAKGASLSGACHKVMFRPSSSAPNMGDADASSTASIVRPRRHHHHYRRFID